MAANKSVPSCQSKNVASVCQSSSLNLIGLGNDRAGGRGSMRVLLARALLQTPAQPGLTGVYLEEGWAASRDEGDHMLLLTTLLCR